MLLVSFLACLLVGTSGRANTMKEAENDAPRDIFPGEFGSMEIGRAGAGPSGADRNSRGFGQMSRLGLESPPPEFAAFSKEDSMAASQAMADIVSTDQFLERMGMRDGPPEDKPGNDAKGPQYAHGGARDRQMSRQNLLQREAALADVHQQDDGYYEGSESDSYYSYDES